MTMTSHESFRAAAQYLMEFGDGQEYPWRHPYTCELIATKYYDLSEACIKGGGLLKYEPIRAIVRDLERTFKPRLKGIVIQKDWEGLSRIQSGKNLFAKSEEGPWYWWVDDFMTAEDWREFEAWKKLM